MQFESNFRAKTQQDNGIELLDPVAMNLVTFGEHILQSLKMQGSSFKFIKVELGLDGQAESYIETDFSISQLSGVAKYLSQTNRQKASLAILFDRTYKTFYAESGDPMLRTSDCWGISVDFPNHEAAKNFYSAFSGTVRSLRIQNIPGTDECL